MNAVAVSPLADIEARIRRFRARDLGAQWQNLAPSAVVLPLCLHEGELALLFTKRSAALRSHKGQIAFPGGRRDENDATLWDTAQRECWEELGIAPAALRLLGRLDETPVLTVYRITPFVAFAQTPFALVPAPKEVEEAFYVPLARFLDPAVHSFEPRELWGHTVVIHSFDVWREPIWGATGRIVAQFLEVGLEYVPPAFADWRAASQASPPLT